MKLQNSLLSVAVAVCTVEPLWAQTLTTWDSPVKVTAAQGALTKSAGCAGCPDSGALSTGRFTSGDGHAEFVAPAIAELYAGLGADVSASTSSSAINHAFSLTTGGYWEVRERGVYKKDGTYAAGDRFRVAVEHGVVVYRKNGTIVYTSTVAPVYPLGLDVTLYSLGASISGATVSSAAPPPEPDPEPTPDPAPSPSPGSAGAYSAVTDRAAYAKPLLPALGPANSKITDPIFQSQITRITDAVTRPGLPNRSYRTPSSPHQNAWSAGGTYFYVVSGDGSVIPFRFDPATGTAQRLQPSATGAGGLVLNFYIEPGFSYVDDAVIYGSVAGGNLHTIDQYNFSTGSYTRILDLETIVSGLSGTYIGGISSSAGASERIMVMFGGSSQDRHHLVLVFDRDNPANRLLLDSHANRINGQPTAIPMNFSLHHVAIDRSGRYVMLYTTWADQSGTRKAPQSVVWDTQTGVLTELPVATLPYGHDAFGYGVSVNQDCCVNTTWDAAQWQFRNLSTPTTTRDLLPIVLTPKEIYFEDHTTWNNARADALVPVISGTFRYGTSGAAWRALDDEIIAIQTDLPGQDPTIWRFAHHRSNPANDNDPAYPSFWYEPRPNVSADGRWVLFTSNWEKTLGTAADAEPGTGKRQDVFLVQLKTPDSTPPPPPVTITSSTLPGGTVGAAYSAALSASGGSGTFVWSVSGGTLPAGLALNASTGAISGTPSTAGTFTFVVTSADASNAANSASATLTVTIAAAPPPPPSGPLDITSPRTLPAAKVGVPYAYTITAANVTGTAKWSVAGGSLPPGITLNATTGVLSGTPAKKGTFHFNARVADSVSSDTLTLTLSVK
jgi:hypothetical protein